MKMYNPWNIRNYQLVSYLAYRGGDNKLQQILIVYNISVYAYVCDRLSMYAVKKKSTDLNDFDIFIHNKNYLSIYRDIYFPLK